MHPIRRLLEFGHIDVVFQPLVDLRSQQVFAYEALVRSLSAEFDGPVSLFKAAVEEGCTGELGRLIRMMAVRRCPTHPLFLNIHPNELNERWLVQPDDPIFQHSEDVYLEITESVPLSHFELCQTILREVRRRGVYLVVDDLGAGYSNLKYIADLHPRVVKLDRELILGIGSDPRLFRLVCAIVDLCRDLDAKVVAEGIETVEELEAVRDAGAHYGQGYLLARPMYPIPEITWPYGVSPRCAGSMVPDRPSGMPMSDRSSFVPSSRPTTPPRFVVEDSISEEAHRRADARKEADSPSRATKRRSTKLSLVSKRKGRE